MGNTMELKIDAQARGVRIITGEQCKDRRKVLNQLIALAEAAGFNEVTLPSVEPASVYTDKAGKEILGQMYEFPDKKNRQLCLRPEGTATIQLIADAHFRQQKDVRLWYFERCWRYERPQEGRYREFYQFGLEILNPTSATIRDELIELATSMIAVKTNAFEVANRVKRGLDYYTEDGFEIAVPALGSQKQVVGGGRYPQGIGFGIGFDRLMLC